MRHLLTAVVLIAASASAVTAAATLKFTPPADWVSKAPSSSMRLAEYTVPKVAGDPEDASVTVFFFGATQGGNVQANIDRWTSQMAQPDGRASKDVAKMSTMTSASGLKISLLDVSGTYVAEVAPGSPQRFNKTGFRQIAVYIETPGGPYFVKLLGPAATVAKTVNAFSAFLQTATFVNSLIQTSDQSVCGVLFLMIQP